MTFPFYLLLSNKINTYNMCKISNKKQMINDQLIIFLIPIKISSIYSFKIAFQIKWIALNNWEVVFFHFRINNVTEIYEVTFTIFPLCFSGSYQKKYFSGPSYWFLKQNFMLQKVLRTCFLINLTNILWAISQWSEKYPMKLNEPP